jgi:hypothetical protein
MTDHKSVAEPHVLEYKICNIISYTLICLRNDANPSNQLIRFQSFMCRIYTSSMERQYIYWWSPANRMHQRVDQASTTLFLVLQFPWYIPVRFQHVAEVGILSFLAILLLSTNRQFNSRTHNNVT